MGKKRKESKSFCCYNLHSPVSQPNKEGQIRRESTYCTTFFKNEGNTQHATRSQLLKLATGYLQPIRLPSTYERNIVKQNQNVVLLRIMNNACLIWYDVIRKMHIMSNVVQQTRTCHFLSFSDTLVHTHAFLSSLFTSMSGQTHTKNTTITKKKKTYILIKNHRLYTYAQQNATMCLELDLLVWRLTKTKFFLQVDSCFSY